VSGQVRDRGREPVFRDLPPPEVKSHTPGCWHWHPECAKLEIARLHLIILQQWHRIHNQS